MRPGHRIGEAQDLAHAGLGRLVEDLGQEPGCAVGGHGVGEREGRHGALPTRLNFRPDVGERGHRGGNAEDGDGDADEAAGLPNPERFLDDR